MLPFGISLQLWPSFSVIETFHLSSYNTVEQTQNSIIFCSAENSNSSIHMSEFYMIEAEETFVESINDITQRIESVIKSVTSDLLENHAKEINDAYMKYLTDEKRCDEKDRFNWLQKSFPIITYAEAATILKKQTNFDEKQGLSKSDEFALVDHFGAPIFVIDWPRDLKPFYMRTCRHNDQLVSLLDSN